MTNKITKTKVWKLNSRECDSEIFRDATGKYYLRVLTPISTLEAATLVEERDLREMLDEIEKNEEALVDEEMEAKADLVRKYHEEEYQVGLL